MHRHHIGLGHELLKADWRSATLADFIIRQFWITPNYLHAKRLGQMCNAPADIANPHDTDRQAFDFVSHQIFTRRVSIRAHHTIRLGDAMLHRQQQPDRMLGHRVGIAAGLIHDQHTMAVTRIEVNRIKTCA